MSKAEQVETSVHELIRGYSAIQLLLIKFPPLYAQNIRAFLKENLINSVSENADHNL
jgi:hypothetical protein